LHSSRIGTVADPPATLVRTAPGIRRGDPGQPTEPSICSSMSRLHSTAYSIGSVRVIG